VPARPERELSGSTRPHGSNAPVDAPAQADAPAGVGTTGPDEQAVIELLLVDDEHVMRHGLQVLLDQQRDLEVVAQAASLKEATALDVEPRVVVTDLELPDARGGEVVAALRSRYPDRAILVLTRSRHPAKVQDAVAAGAHGYLLKTAQPSELLVGVRAVAHGETYLQPSLGVALARWSGTGSAAGDGDALPERLSPKEEQVLRLVALGHTNAEVAELLGVSLRTVETHRARVLQKLGHPTRSELVRHAQRAGLVDLET
jgi:two-component system response regulator NreC